ncbi:unnamed protein product, partial [Musa acuminata var. zebrina]
DLAEWNPRKSNSEGRPPCNAASEEGYLMAWLIRFSSLCCFDQPFSMGKVDLDSKGLNLIAPLTLHYRSDALLSSSTPPSANSRSFRIDQPASSSITMNAPNHAVG